MKRLFLLLLFLIPTIAFGEGSLLEMLCNESSMITFANDGSSYMGYEYAPDDG